MLCVFCTNMAAAFALAVVQDTLGHLGGVYMRKLAPARVSYRHDFLISYRVYMMTGLFHI